MADDARVPETDRLLLDGGWAAGGFVCVLVMAAGPGRAGPSHAASVALHMYHRHQHHHCRPRRHSGDDVIGYSD